MQRFDFDEDVEDEYESDEEWEAAVETETSSYDDMQAAYAYDNEIFEWSFESVGPDTLVVVVEEQARGVPHLHPCRTLSVYP